MKPSEIKRKPFFSALLFQAIAFGFLGFQGILCTATIATKILPEPIKLNIPFEGINYDINMPEYVLEHAKKDFGQLSREFNGTFFNTKILKNSKVMRTLMTTPSRKLRASATCGQLGSTKIDKNLTAYWTYFNRGSDTLLLVGGGLANDRDILAPFVAMFPTYDIVLFDYRGHGLNHKPRSLKGKVTKRYTGIDCSVVTLCNKEEEEVLSVLSEFKNRKNYKNTFGIGLCYSAVTFAKAQAVCPNSFDKLIFDGSWPMLKELTQKFCKDPKLFLDPQRGSTTGRLFGRIPPLRWLFRIIGEWLFGMKFDKGINALESFAKLNVPVLFFHSTRDLLITNEQFQRIWEIIPHNQKIAVITPERHLQNFIKHKELFALMGQLFFENSYQKTARTLLNENIFEKEKRNLFYPLQVQNGYQTQNLAG
jgi:pimeloyl-ACP methyl ester carboxylesterase